MTNFYLRSSDPQKNVINTYSLPKVSGHPRNNLKHENTYLTVELFEGNWTVVATDANWETLYVRNFSFIVVCVKDRTTSGSFLPSLLISSHK